MSIVIVTAEPRGAYHLTPLGPALDNSDGSFTHLVPYPEPVQGTAAAAVTSDVTVLDRCDLLVVTGGTFSAWTKLAARHAMTLGVPVVCGLRRWWCSAGRSGSVRVVTRSRRW